MNRLLKMYKANIRIFLQKILGFYSIMCIYILALKLEDNRSNMIRDALHVHKHRLLYHKSNEFALANQ